MVQGEEPLLIEDRPQNTRSERNERGQRSERSQRAESRERPSKEINYEAKPLKDYPDIEMRRYHLDVGYKNDVKPGHIVGAIANEAEIDSCYLGNIDIYDDFTLIDMPDGMPGEVFKILKKTRVAGRPLQIKAFKPEQAKEKQTQKRSSGGNNQSQSERRPQRASPPKANKKHGKRKGKRPAVANRKRNSRNQD